MALPVLVSSYLTREENGLHSPKIPDDKMLCRLIDAIGHYENDGIGVITEDVERPSGPNSIKRLI